jgi:ATP-dependent DNA helicase RecG
VLCDDGLMLLPQTELVRVLGDRTAKSFAKHLNLHTVADLLQHYPRRYGTRGELTPLFDLPVGESVSVVADVVQVQERRMKGKSGSILEVRITDGKGFLTLTFFNQAWRQKDLHPGVRGLFAGKIGSYRGDLQLAHPEYELFATEVDTKAAKAWAEEPIPIYPAASAVPTWAIARAVGVILDTLDDLSDEVPAELAKAEKLLPLVEAFEKVHRPAKVSDYKKARETLRFHEAFELQATLVQRRLSNQHLKTNSRPRAESGWVSKLDSALPFELTNDQIQVSNEIFDDLEREHPMNRLLQGEVGSGKTLVALRAMLAVCDSGGQAALLAPTEVLASQHFDSIQRSLGEDLAKKLGLTLLTGQLGTADRKRALLGTVSGKAQLVVGTHALIAEKVEFYDLGLVVIDEQHRFGVEQREALRQKGKLPPHTLTMTATPIPRTLAVSVFGDLDVSTISTLPKGRQAIVSHVVRQADQALVARVWSRLAEEVAAGRQAFVVCPRIDETETVTPVYETAEGEVDEIDQPKPAIASVLGLIESLRQLPVLQGLSIEALHGRQSAEEKAEVMARFVAGQINILVSTTVIEVGVDVANATAMVIVDADRFGISQLHQLRGRVGRGGLPGLCLLLTAADADSPALSRLQAVAATTDGFELSELDLELRREGDVLGAVQSGGRSSLRLLSVIKNAELIQRARRMVLDLFDADPTLERHENLAESLKRIEQAAAEYLTKS